MIFGKDRVLKLEPIAGAAGDVGRPQAPRHDPLEVELAGMAKEHALAITQRRQTTVYQL
jgi:hypothetical protein